MCHGGRSNVGVKVSSTVGDSLFLDNQVVPSQDVLRQVVKIPTLCGGISATHFPASKKYLRFYDRKLKIYTVIATYI